MELQKINQRIAVVNGESKRLNGERQVLIGKRQALEKQLSDLLATYNKDYGVELTPETIEAEVARVSAMKEEEVANIEKMLALISEGRFEDAQAIADGASDGGVVASAEAPAVAETTAHVEAPVVPPAAPVQSEQTVAPPTFAPPAQPEHTVAAPVQPEQPVAPHIQSNLPTFEPPAPPTQSSDTDEVPAPPPPIQRSTPKAPLGTPKIGVPPVVGTAGEAGPMSFQAVLSGQAFNPQAGG